MGFLLRVIFSLALAAGLGAGSAWVWLDQLAANASVRNGAWTANTKIGSKEAGPYTRAFVAKVGLLALNAKETIYFFAGADETGAPLDGSCTYLIRSGAIPARWSSITAYGADHFLIPNPQKRYSYLTSQIAAADGSFEFRVGPKEVAGDWLPVAPGAPFSLSLRMYNPSPDVTADPASFAAPRILKEGCS